MKQHIFHSGPPLAVELKFYHRELYQVILSIDTQFSCQWENEDDPELVIEWLEAYSKKQPIAAEHLLNLSTLPPFHNKTLTYLQSIPFGKTASYGEVASSVGNPRGSRAVGQACNRNPFPILIPCHRVIAAGGKLGGFAIDMRIKQALLEFEGI